MPDDPKNADNIKAPASAEGESLEVNPLDISSVIALLREEKDDDTIKKAIANHVTALALRHKVDRYKLILLFDDHDEITHWHANRIYRAAPAPRANMT